MKQLAFLVNSSTPSLQNIAHNLRHYFWLFQLIVTVFCISTLGFGVVAFGRDGFYERHQGSLVCIVCIYAQEVKVVACT